MVEETERRSSRRESKRRESKHDAEGEEEKHKYKSRHSSSKRRSSTRKSSSKKDKTRSKSGDRRKKDKDYGDSSSVKATTHKKRSSESADKERSSNRHSKRTSRTLDDAAREATKSVEEPKRRRSSSEENRPSPPLETTTTTAKPAMVTRAVSTPSTTTNSTSPSASPPRTTSTTSNPSASPPRQVDPPAAASPPRQATIVPKPATPPPPPPHVTAAAMSAPKPPSPPPKPVQAPAPAAPAAPTSVGALRQKLEAAAATSRAAAAGEAPPTPSKAPPAPSTPSHSVPAAAPKPTPPPRSSPPSSAAATPSSLQSVGQLRQKLEAAAATSRAAAAKTPATTETDWSVLGTTPATTPAPAPVAVTPEWQQLLQEANLVPKSTPALGVAATTASSQQSTPSRQSVGQLRQQMEARSSPKSNVQGPPLPIRQTTTNSAPWAVPPSSSQNDYTPPPTSRSSKVEEIRQKLQQDLTSDALNTTMDTDVATGHGWMSSPPAKSPPRQSFGEIRNQLEAAANASHAEALKSYSEQRRESSRQLGQHNGSSRRERSTMLDDTPDRRDYHHSRSREDRESSNNGSSRRERSTMLDDTPDRRDYHHSRSREDRESTSRRGDFGDRREHSRRESSRRGEFGDKRESSRRGEFGERRESRRDLERRESRREYHEDDYDRHHDEYRHSNRQESRREYHEDDYDQHHDEYRHSHRHSSSDRHLDRQKSKRKNDTEKTLVTSATGQSTLDQMQVAEQVDLDKKHSKDSKRKKRKRNSKRERNSKRGPVMCLIVCLLLLGVLGVGAWMWLRMRNVRAKGANYTQLQDDDDDFISLPATPKDSPPISSPPTRTPTTPNPTVEPGMPTVSPSKIPTAQPTKTASNGPTAPPSNGPTAAPTTQSGWIGNIIFGVARFGGEEFNRPDTYQRKAMEWVLVEGSNIAMAASDELPFEDLVVQLYALACTYYSTYQVPNDVTNVLLDADEVGPWTNSDRWMMSGTNGGCDWYGVICNRKGQVEKISLPNNGLTGNVPPELSLLKDTLLYLDLFNNDVHNVGGNGNSFLGEMNRLQYLYLGQTFFEYDGVPSELSNLSNLVELDISFTSWFGPLNSDPWSSLTRLEYLVMNGNVFNTTLPDELVQLPNLQYLYVVDSFLKGDLEWVSRMPAIRELWIDNNPLSTEIPISLSTVSTLASFSAGNCGLTGSIPASLGNMADSMTHLWLNDNNLSNNIPGDLSRLSNLQTLSLTGNGFAGGLPTEICTNKLLFEELQTVEVDSEVPCECCTCCGHQSVSIQGGIGTR